MTRRGSRPGILRSGAAAPWLQQRVQDRLPPALRAAPPGCPPGRRISRPRPTSPARPMRQAARRRTAWARHRRNRPEGSWPDAPSDRDVAVRAGDPEALSPSKHRLPALRLPRSRSRWCNLPRGPQGLRRRPAGGHRPMSWSSTRRRPAETRPSRSWSGMPTAPLRHHRPGPPDRPRVSRSSKNAPQGAAETSKASSFAGWPPGSE